MRTTNIHVTSPATFVPQVLFHGVFPPSTIGARSSHRPLFLPDPASSPPGGTDRPRRRPGGAPSRRSRRGTKTSRGARERRPLPAGAPQRRRASRRPRVPLPVRRRPRRPARSPRPEHRGFRGRTSRELALAPGSVLERSSSPRRPRDLDGRGGRRPRQRRAHRRSLHVGACSTSSICASAPPSTGGSPPPRAARAPARGMARRRRRPAAAPRGRPPRDGGGRARRDARSDAPRRRRSQLFEALRARWGCAYFAVARAPARDEQRSRRAQRGARPQLRHFDALPLLGAARCTAAPTKSRSATRATTG